MFISSIVNLTHVFFNIPPKNVLTPATTPRSVGPKYRRAVVGFSDCDVDLYLYVSRNM